MRGEAVPERVATCYLADVGALDRRLNRFLEVILRNMMARSAAASIDENVYQINRMCTTFSIANLLRLRLNRRRHDYLILIPNVKVRKNTISFLEF